MLVARWPEYVATWRRQRLLLCVPVILAVVIAGWSVFGAPKSYISTGSVWVDTGGPTGSTLGNVNPASTPPAQQEQSVLQELLATKQFVAAVGAASSLQSYLKANATAGSGPSALLSKLAGGHGTLAQRVASAVGGGVSSSVPGPQVMDLSFSGPSPTVARSTLAALIAQLQVWTTRYSEFNGQNEAGYYQSQVTTAQQTLKTAQQQAATYAAQHRNVTANSDPVYSSLLGVVSTSATQLAQAQNGLADAHNTSQSGAGLIVRTVDAPSIPTGATKGKKVELEGLLGGLIAGLLISLLITILMTRSTQLRAIAASSEPTELPKPAAKSPPPRTSSGAGAAKTRRKPPEDDVHAPPTPSGHTHPASAAIGMAPLRTSKRGSWLTASDRRSE